MSACNVVLHTTTCFSDCALCDEYEPPSFCLSIHVKANCSNCRQNRGNYFHNISVTFISTVRYPFPFRFSFHCILMLRVEKMKRKYHPHANTLLTLLFHTLYFHSNGISFNPHLYPCIFLYSITKYYNRIRYRFCGKNPIFYAKSISFYFLFVRAPFNAHISRWQISENKFPIHSFLYTTHTTQSDGNIF